MRKLFLSLLLAAIMPAVAVADDAYDKLGNLVNPPGTDVEFQLYAWVMCYRESGYEEGRKYYETHIRFDGKDVYFKDLLPTANTGSWVKGSYIDDTTIRIQPQTYYIEQSEYGTVTTYLKMWMGPGQVGSKYPNTEVDYYDLVVGTDKNGNMTLKYKDYYGYVSTHDKTQMAEYDYASELTYTRMPDPPSTDMIKAQPAGKYQRYTMQADMYSYTDGDLWASFGYKADLVWGDDGNVYFSTLTPDYQYTGSKGWIKGTYDKSTGIITVQPWQAVEKVAGYDDVYTFLCNYDYDNNEYLDTPLYFKVESNGYITSTSENQYTATVYMQGRLKKGQCAVNNLMTLFPVSEEPVSAPTGLAAKDYAFSYSDPTEGDQAYLITGGVKGNEVYLKGISTDIPDAWVKGTIDGDKVTFTSRQLLASTESNKYLYFNGGRYDEEAEHPVITSEIVMNYDSSTGKIWSAKGEDRKSADYFLINAAGEEYKEIMSMEAYNVSLQPQGEWTPANPATPSFTSEFHMQDKYGNDEDHPYVTVIIPNLDVNGAYLHPENLYYRFYWNMDKDMPYTFKAEDYIYLGQDVTYMPTNYYDNYDITVSGTKHVVYLYPEDSYSYISVQSVYQYDGQTYESEIFTRNIGPYIDPDDDPAGIESITQHPTPNTQHPTYNLLGQKVGKGAKGIVIMNGKKIIR